jgi:hypothetical protein
MHTTRLLQRRQSGMLRRPGVGDLLRGGLHVRPGRRWLHGVPELPEMYGGRHRVRHRMLWERPDVRRVGVELQVLQQRSDRLWAHLLRRRTEVRQSENRALRSVPEGAAGVRQEVLPEGPGLLRRRQGRLLQHETQLLLQHRCGRCREVDLLQGAERVSRTRKRIGPPSTGVSAGLLSSRALRTRHGRAQGFCQLLPAGLRAHGRKTRSARGG